MPKIKTKEYMDKSDLEILRIEKYLKQLETNLTYTKNFMNKSEDELKSKLIDTTTELEKLDSKFQKNSLGKYINKDMSSIGVPVLCLGMVGLFLFSLAMYQGTPFSILMTAGLGVSALAGSEISGKVFSKPLYQRFRKRDKIKINELSNKKAVFEGLLKEGPNVKIELEKRIEEVKAKLEELNLQANNKTIYENETKSISNNFDDLELNKAETVNENLKLEHINVVSKKPQQERKNIAKRINPLLSEKEKQRIRAQIQPDYTNQKKSNNPTSEKPNTITKTENLDKEEDLTM